MGGTVGAELGAFEVYGHHRRGLLGLLAAALAISFMEIRPFGRPTGLALQSLKHHTDFAVYQRQVALMHANVAIDLETSLSFLFED